MWVRLLKNTMKIVIIIIDLLVIAYIQRCSLLHNRHTTLMSYVILNVSFYSGLCIILSTEVVY